MSLKSGAQKCERWRANSPTVLRLDLLQHICVKYVTDLAGRRISTHHWCLHHVIVDFFLQVILGLDYARPPKPADENHCTQQDQLNRQNGDLPILDLEVPLVGPYSLSRKCAFDRSIGGDVDHDTEGDRVDDEEEA